MNRENCKIGGEDAGVVLLRTNETIAVYRSKMAFFQRMWQKVKVLSRT